MENNRPLVTVNILSYNRKDELRNTLKKVYEQDYKNIEIIVVDNASSDGTHEMVKSEFPEVKLIQLEKNIGIAG
ncbi:MAG: glycosyltransferase, partial [Ignavibacteriales bacterium]